VLGGQILLEDPARTKRIKLFDTGTMVDLYTDTHNLSVRSFGHDCLINWWNGDGKVGIGTQFPQQKLHVGGEFLQVDGLAGESAYIGGDGSMFSPITGGPDVKIGSMNNNVQAVHLWNIPYNGWMDLHCRWVYMWSDREAKTHIAPIKDALDTVQRLRGVQFDWKHAPKRPGSQKEIGLVAQEVEEVLPQIVERRRGMATVAYTALIPLLIEAVKELKQQNDGLTDDVKALQKQVAALGEPDGVSAGATKQTRKKSRGKAT
jgi:hypothetical protein